MPCYLTHAELGFNEDVGVKILRGAEVLLRDSSAMHGLDQQKLGSDVDRIYSAIVQAMIDQDGREFRTEQLTKEFAISNVTIEILKDSVVWEFELRDGSQVRLLFYLNGSSGYVAFTPYREDPDQDTSSSLFDIIDSGFDSMGEKQGEVFRRAIEKEDLELLVNELRRYSEAVTPMLERYSMD